MEITVNENKDVYDGLAAKFDRRFGNKHEVCDCKAIEFGAFTVSALLATPKQNAPGA